MKLELTKEGAAALREFSDAIPTAINLIVEATDELEQKYDSFSSSLGEHADSFKKMIENIKDAQKIAEEAVMKLPKKMKETAELIETYVKTTPTVS